MTKFAKLLEEDRYQDQPRSVNISFLFALRVPINLKLRENLLTSSCPSISSHKNTGPATWPFQGDTLGWYPEIL